MSRPQRPDTYSTIAKQMEDLCLNLGLALPHELRTPLSAILGFTEYLVSQGPESLPEADKLLQIQTSIYDNALRLQRLVENYLLYVQLKLVEHNAQAHHTEMWNSPERINTRSLISSVAMRLAQKHYRQQDLRMQFVETEIHVSSQGLYKIAEELLDNALKFSSPGTQILVTTTRTSDRWTLSIEDQGRGMTTEQIANIGAFMQFERRSYEQQGTGLGLALTVLLVHLNGGKLQVESHYGQGTTITVAFGLDSKAL